MWGLTTGSGSAWEKWLTVVYGEDDFDLFGLLEKITPPDPETDTTIDLYDPPESYIECSLIEMRTYMARAEGL